MYIPICYDELLHQQLKIRRRCNCVCWYPINLNYNMWYLTGGSLSPRHGASSGCGWRNALQYGGSLRIYRTKSRWQLTMGGLPARVLGKVLTIPHRKIFRCYETIHKAYYFRMVHFSVQGQVAGCCECGNEPSRYIKYRDFFFDWLRTC